MHGHSFEGWFSSEDDFQDQLTRHLLECPLCGDSQVVKLPSAPRLNLSSTSAPATSAAPSSAQPVSSTTAVLPPASLQAAWLQVVRRVVAATEDVGERFTEEARRIHYGEAAERGIRGQATIEQTEELLDEGIAVMPLPMPPGFKDTLQ